MNFFHERYSNARPMFSAETLRVRNIGKLENLMFWVLFSSRCSQHSLTLTAKNKNILNFMIERDSSEKKVYKLFTMDSVEEPNSLIYHNHHRARLTSTVELSALTLQ